MELLDTTLREGEQCYGVLFSVDDKIRIARLLDQVGVDFIEVGHPAAAPSIRDAADAIARLGLRARLVGHARLDRREIALVGALGLPWVGLFSGINAYGLARYGLARSAVLDRIERSIGFAKDIGLSVRFTCEDASRTDAGALAELYEMVLAMGADRVSYADTVGIETPERLGRLAERLRFNELHFHFHDDHGRALANAKTAARLGARCIDASVLGIGERTGIVDLERLLSSSGRGCPDGDALRTAGGIVRAAMDQRRYSRRRYAHKSGIHIHGIGLDPRQYEAEGAVATGEQRIVVLSKLIGRSGLRMLLAKHGIGIETEWFDSLFRHIKSDDRLELAEADEIVEYLGTRLDALRSCTAAAS